jgi:hypothetical protein
MTRRAFWLIVVAYAFLAIGATLSLYLFGRQADRIKENTHRLNLAVGAACEIGVAPDNKEALVIHQLATRQLVISTHDCQVIVRMLETPNDE